MARKRSQRIGIWVIAIVMFVGTLGSFALIVVANNNSQNAQADEQAKIEEFQKMYQEYQNKVDAQAAELSKQYYDEFVQYKDEPAGFTIANVDGLETKDLKIGDGEEITADSEYSAYYIGWNPEGKVFDQSIQGDSLRAPIAGGDLIEGWNQGVLGMKVGGVRQLTIPADLAYGATGSGEDIPPNTPIKFIVMIIPKQEEIPYPDFSQFYN